MKKYKFLSLVIVSLFLVTCFLGLFSKVEASFVPSGSRCYPDIMADGLTGNVDDYTSIPTVDKRVTCPFCQEKGGDMLHLKWELTKKTFTNPICTVSCQNHNGVGACNGAISKDGQGLGTTTFKKLEDLNLKPKDDVFVTKVEDGNWYQVSCCEKCPEGSKDCSLFCKNNSSVYSVSALALRQCSPLDNTGALNISTDNPTPRLGQMVNVKWELKGTGCGAPQILFNVWSESLAFPGSWYHSDFGLISAGAISPGTWSWKNVSIEYSRNFVIQGEIKTGPCEGGTSNILPVNFISGSAQSNSWLANAWSAWQGLFK